jgi:hypothetical protein
MSMSKKTFRLGPSPSSRLPTSWPTPKPRIAAAPKKKLPRKAAAPSAQDLSKRRKRRKKRPLTARAKRRREMTQHILDHFHPNGYNTKVTRPGEIERCVVDNWEAEVAKCGKTLKDYPKPSRTTVGIDLGFRKG